jgi:hypothetical protein
VYRAAKRDPEDDGNERDRRTAEKCARDVGDIVIGVVRQKVVARKVDRIVRAERSKERGTKRNHERA